MLFTFMGPVHRQKSLALLKLFTRPIPLMKMTVTHFIHRKVLKACLFNDFIAFKPKNLKVELTSSKLGMIRRY